jgi:hypothetical protein
MPERQRTPNDLDEIDIPEGLDLPDVAHGDEELGVTDEAEEIDWTPPGGSDDDASDLAIGEHDIDTVEPEPSSAALDAPSAIDGGDDDLLPDEVKSVPGDDALTIVDESDGIETTDAHEEDDGGTEGTSEDITREIDEDALPELDADEDGAFDVDDLMRELVASGFGREGQGPPWVLYEEWTSAEPFADVAASSGRVVAVGAEVVVFDPGAASPRRTSLTRSASRVALSPASIVVGMDESVALLSPTDAPLVLFEGRRRVDAVAVASGRVWLIAGEELWVVASPPSTPQRVRSTGAIDLAIAGTHLLLLSSESGSLVIERYRGDDGDWQRLAVPEVPREPARLVVSSSGREIALVLGDGALVSWDAGASFARVPIERLVGAAFAGAKLLALSTPEGGVTLVTVREGRREEIPLARGLEELLPNGGDRSLVRVAWCEAREALLVGGPRGSSAIGPRRTH